MSTDGGPAFPVVVPLEAEEVEDGMTLRDYFAAKAMQAIVSCFRCQWSDNPAKENDGPATGWHNRDLITDADSTHEAASDAYAIADAMLAARVKPRA